MDEEQEPSFSERLFDSIKKFVSFFNLYATYRRKYPKKGSMDWILKQVQELSKTGHEIAIKDGKSTVQIKSGKYTESISLRIGVDLIGGGGGGGSGKVPYSGEGARSLREAMERQWPD